MNRQVDPGGLNTHTWVYVRFSERIYKLFWFRVANDGSIYIGLADGKPSYVFQARPAVEALLSKESVAIEGTLHRADEGNISKMSFHPSGKIHVDFDPGIFAPPFWDVPEQRLLVAMLFRDTHRMDQVSRAKDFTRASIQIIAGEFGIREDDNLQCAILLHPLDDDPLVPVDNARYVQWARAYEDFTDERKRPMIVRFLLLGKDADGKTHQHTRVIYPYAGQNANLNHGPKRQSSIDSASPEMS